jgi:hypothetical protein
MNQVFPELSWQLIGETLSLLPKYKNPPLPPTIFSPHLSTTTPSVCNICCPRLTIFGLNSALSLLLSPSVAPICPFLPTLPFQ